MVNRVRSGLRQLSDRALPLSVAAALTCGCGGEAPDGETIAVETGAVVSKSSLLQRWAPVHYQDVNKNGSGLGGKADYIIRFDYEPASNSGDWWNAWDKWDNLSGSGNDLSGVMYGSVTETVSHWFLYYMTYHARDWTNSAFEEEHENDSEGVVLAIRKDWSSEYGTLEAMLTIAHEGVRAYSANPASVWPRDGVAREIQWELFNGDFHPATYQAAEGHPTAGCSDIGTKCNQPNEDGIRYVPNGVAQTPGTVGVWTTVSYAIRSIDELWQHRFDPLMFNQNVSNPAFNGNESGGCGDAWLATCVSYGADPMWRSITGSDSAAQFTNLFDYQQVLPPSTSYLRNAFKGCEDMTVARSTPGNTPQSCFPGCTSQIVSEDPYCGNTAWDSYCVAEVTSICGILIAVDPW